MNNHEQPVFLKHEQWRKEADCVRRMFADLARGWAPSIRCPFYEDDWHPCDGIPHMHATVFGAVEDTVSKPSGPGLIIQFTCEQGHEWQLRWSDHSGCTSLTIVETNLFCHECGPYLHPKGSDCF
jgi:hypothetical protein